MPNATEPRNPLYFLLLLVGLIFTLTAVAYAVIPVLEQKALEAGEEVPPSAARTALREEGWKWLLYELAVLVALGLAAMGLDRYRRLQSEAKPNTIPPANHEGKPPPM